MVELTIPIKLFISLLLGAAIGLEREIHAHSENRDTEAEKQSVLGIRSFALTTLFGSLCGLLVEKFLPLFLLLAGAFIALLLSYYIIVSLITKDIGITTEIGVLISFLIGFFVSTQFLPIVWIVALTVVLILILSRKEKIKQAVSIINKDEINAFVSYAIIALVILPFLPNRSFTLSNIPFFSSILSVSANIDPLNSIELINPYRLWFIVALITGVDVAGYILEKTVGQKKGLFLTSFVGGFISSTATTQSLAIESKKSKHQNQLVASAIFANLSSFFQLTILITSINTLFLVNSMPIIFAIIFSALILGVYYLRKDKKASEKKDEKKLDTSKIFSLPQALKFVFLFLTIRVAAKISLVFLGNSGIILVSALGSIPGIDAVTINISELAGKTVSYDTAILALIVANSVNLLMKTLYSFLQGSREFALKLAQSLSIIVVSSIIIYLITL